MSSNFCILGSLQHSRFGLASRRASHLTFAYLDRFSTAALVWRVDVTSLTDYGDTLLREDQKITAASRFHSIVGVRSFDMLDAL